MHSHVRPVQPSPPPSVRNLPTQALGGRVPEPVDLRAAYGFARGLAEVLPRPAHAGHRLVWIRRTSFSTAVLPAVPDAFLVAGRHSACDACLVEDPSVALRHVLVRSLALPSGGVALRVVDLHTGTGFRLEDGSIQSSMLAEGPVAFAVGEFALVALPLSSSSSDDEPLPDELPRVVHEASLVAREQLEALAVAMSPYRANARHGHRSSRITRLPMPSFVGDPPAPSVGRLAGGRFTVTVRRGDAEASLSLTEEDLVRGVILGRSERCVSESLRRVTEMGTSRVHLLLVREGSEIHAYDLASTQGTFLGPKRVRRARLPERGATMLILGNTSEAVQLTWRAL